MHNFILLIDKSRQTDAVVTASPEVQLQSRAQCGYDVVTVSLHTTHVPTVPTLDLLLTMKTFIMSLKVRELHNTIIVTFLMRINSIPVPTRGGPYPGPADAVSHHPGQDQGEVWESVWSQWEGLGGVQQGWRWPQPITVNTDGTFQLNVHTSILQSWRRETPNELQHQETTDGRQQERVRQPTSEN